MRSLQYIIPIALSTLFYFIFDNPLKIANYQFYIYIYIFILDLCKKKEINLIQIWIISYLYIINSEILLNPYNFLFDNLWAVRYLGSANNLVLLGYFMAPTHMHMSTNNTKPNNNTRMNGFTRIVLFGLITFFLVSYILMNYKHALLARAVGRAQIDSSETDAVNIFSTIVSSCRYVLPAIIAYYFSQFRRKRYLIIAFLLSSPIFIMLIWSGSRFPVLYSFLGFILAGNIFNIRRLNFRQMLIGCVCLISLNLMANLMKVQRVSGYETIEVSDNIGEEFELLSQKISYEFSPEGVVNMTNYSHEYFNAHEHMYGKSTAFITYFWVPRFIWPNKPTMLGYWLIRTKNPLGFSSGHSVSLGFPGDLYADFGMFSLLFMILLGFLIKKMDTYCSKSLTTNNYNRVLAAMLYPYVFFIVRSPMTGSITMIGILVVYYTFKFAITRAQAVKL